MYRYYSIAAQRFGKLFGNGPEVMAFCPWHNNTKSPALQVNVEKGIYVCFSGECLAKGSLKPKKGAVADDDGQTLMDLLRKAGAPVGTATEVVVPEEVLVRYRSGTDYWSNRGFDAATIQLFELGYSSLTGTAVIPVRRTDGALMGIIQRMLGGGNPKYRNPSGFDRKNRLFGEWLVPDGCRKAVLVEGPVDAMRVWQAGHVGLATYGTSVSNGQIKLLVRLGIQEVVLFFDNDEAGKHGTEALLTGKHDLRKLFHVAIADYTVDGARSDPGAMETAAVDAAVARATNPMQQSLKAGA